MFLSSKTKLHTAILTALMVLPAAAEEAPSVVNKTTDQAIVAAPLNTGEALSIAPGSEGSNAVESSHFDAVEQVEIIAAEATDVDRKTTQDIMVDEVEGSQAVADIAEQLDQQSGSSVANVPVLPAQEIEPLPRAESIDLGKPVEAAKPVVEEMLEHSEPSAKENDEPAKLGDDNSVAEQVEAATDTVGRPFVLLGTEVPPATSTRLMWQPSQGFAGLYSPTPVLVVNGQHKGPTLCLTAAVHGDELNGIEMVRQIMYSLDIDKLRGTVVGVPIVNLQGFHRGTRYLTDRRDLNRYFPGKTGGNSADRIAHSFFHEVILHCDAVVDLHTGSFYRTNLPQLRADLTNPQVVELTQGFGSTVVLHGEGSKGTLRYAAVKAGIPAVTLEAGGPMMLDKDAVDHGVKAIRTLLNKLGMVKQFSLWGDPEPVYYTSIWERAEQGGILFSHVKLGSRVSEGQVLGVVTDPITNVSSEIRSQHRGRILGLALDQVVQPGFAAYHVGIQAPKEQVSPPSPVIDHQTEKSLLSEQRFDKLQALENDSAVPTEVNKVLEDEDDLRH